MRAISSQHLSSPGRSPRNGRRRAPEIIPAISRATKARQLFSRTRDGNVDRTRAARSVACLLAVGGVEAGEDLGTGAELGFAELVERGLDRVEEFVHVAGIGLDKQEPGDDLARRVALLQVSQRRDPF